MLLLVVEQLHEVARVLLRRFRARAPPQDFVARTSGALASKLDVQGVLAIPVDEFAQALLAVLRPFVWRWRHEVDDGLLRSRPRPLGLRAHGRYLASTICPPGKCTHASANVIFSPW